MSLLSIKNLSVSVDDQPIITNLSLEIGNGQVHALMGPNGSGKSTLAYTLMGHPRYIVTQGSIYFNDQDITALSADKRARLGLLLLFQQPVEIPGVSIAIFLKQAYQAMTGATISAADFNKLLLEKMELLSIDPAFAQREVNVGFSGGEKKRFEMLQVLVLKPRLLILDEIDSGLDVDALRLIAHTLSLLKQQQPDMSFLLITHYNRILNYFVPDQVHILEKGTIIRSGTASLASQVEQEGYVSRVT